MLFGLLLPLRGRLLVVATEDRIVLGRAVEDVSQVSDFLLDSGLEIIGVRNKFELAANLHLDMDSHGSWWCRTKSRIVEHSHVKFKEVWPVARFIDCGHGARPLRGFALLADRLQHSDQSQAIIVRRKAIVESHSAQADEVVLQIDATSRVVVAVEIQQLVEFLGVRELQVDSVELGRLVGIVDRDSYSFFTDPDDRTATKECFCVIEVGLDVMDGGERVLAVCE